MGVFIVAVKGTVGLVNKFSVFSAQVDAFIGLFIFRIVLDTHEAVTAPLRCPHKSVDMPFADEHKMSVRSTKTERCLRAVDEREYHVQYLCG